MKGLKTGMWRIELRVRKAKLNILDTLAGVHYYRKSRFIVQQVVKSRTIRKLNVRYWTRSARRASLEDTNQIVLQVQKGHFMLSTTILPTSYNSQTTLNFLNDKIIIHSKQSYKILQGPHYILERYQFKAMDIFPAFVEQREDSRLCQLWIKLLVKAVFDKHQRSVLFHFQQKMTIIVACLLFIETIFQSVYWIGFVPPNFLWKKSYQKLIPLTDVYSQLNYATQNVFRIYPDLHISIKNINKFQNLAFIIETSSSYLNTYMHSELQRLRNKRIGYSYWEYIWKFLLKKILVIWNFTELLGGYSSRHLSKKKLSFQLKLVNQMKFVGLLFYFFDLKFFKNFKCKKSSTKKLLLINTK